MDEESTENDIQNLSVIGVISTMSMIQDDRMFGVIDSYRINANQSEKQGVKIYTGLESILGVLGIITGRATWTNIDGQRVIYNINSMKGFLERNVGLQNAASLKPAQVSKMVDIVAQKYKSKDLSESASNEVIEGILKGIKNESKNYETAKFGLQKETVTLPVKEFNQLLDQLGKYGIKLTTNLNPKNGEMSIGDMPLAMKKGKDGKIASIEVSSQRLTNECVKVLKDNKSTIEQVKKHIESPGTPEEARVFLQAVLTAAQDTDSRTIQSEEEKALEKELDQLSEQLEKFSFKENRGKEFVMVSSSPVEYQGVDKVQISDDEVQPNPNNQIVLRANGNQQVVALLDDTNYQLERATLSQNNDRVQGPTVNIHNIVYTMPKADFLQGLSTYGVPQRVYEFYRAQQGEEIAVTGREMMMIRNTIASMPDAQAIAQEESPLLAIEDVSREAEVVHAKNDDHLKNIPGRAPSTEVVKKIAAKKPEQVTDKELQQIFAYMKQYQGQKAKGTPKAIDSFIDKLSNGQKAKLCEMSWTVGGQPADQKQAYLGYQRYFEGKLKASQPQLSDFSQKDLVSQATKARLGIQ